MLSFLSLFTSAIVVLAQEKPLEWSSKVISQGREAWAPLDTETAFGPSGQELLSKMIDLKEKKDLSCQTTRILNQREQPVGLPASGSFSYFFPSINKTVLVRTQLPPQGKSLTIDLFERVDGQWSERVRSGYEFYPEGGLKTASFLDLQSKARVRSGLLNEEFLSQAHRTLTGQNQRIQTNSPFGSEWLNLLKTADQVFACCSNEACRERVRRHQIDRPADVRDASLKSGQ